MEYVTANTVPVRIMLFFQHCNEDIKSKLLNYIAVPKKKELKRLINCF